MVGLEEHDPGDVTLLLGNTVLCGRDRGEARASRSGWGNLKASVGPADGDVHRADLRTSMADGRTK